MAMQLIKGITFTDIKNMSRRELINRIQARIRSQERQTKEQRAASVMRDAFDN